MVNASYGSFLELARSVSLSPSTVGCEADGKCGRDTLQGCGRLELASPGWPAQQFSVSVEMLSLSILSRHYHTCQLGCLHILEERPLTSPSGYKEAQTDSELQLLRCRSCTCLGGALTETAHPAGHHSNHCMIYFTTTSHYQLKEFKKGQKGDTTSPTTSPESSCRIHLGWRNACTTGRTLSQNDWPHMYTYGNSC